jgi:uncharacterized protein YraI
MRKAMIGACLRRIALAVLGAGALCGASPLASAYSATVMAHAHLRAGPSIEYPPVVTLAPGAVVEVFGCEQGYGWCDAQIGPDRGWIDAAYLRMSAPSGPVIVADAGVTLGVPVITFVLNNYWGSYYQGRPWYARRPYYYNYWNRYPHGRPPPPPHRPIVRPPPRPRPPVGGRPPGNRPPPGGSRPTPGGGGPGSGRPPDGARPPGGSRPTPGGGGPGSGKPPDGARPSGGSRPTPGGGGPGSGKPPDGARPPGGNRPDNGNGRPQPQTPPAPGNGQ